MITGIVISFKDKPEPLLVHDIQGYNVTERWVEVLYRDGSRTIYNERIIEEITEVGV